MHHCHWVCLLYTKDHKNSSNVKALSWETGYEVTRVISWRDLLSLIAQMGNRSFANRVVLPVTAAIYRNGKEKPAVRWSCEKGIWGESDKMLFDFMFRVREGFGIADQCSQLNMPTETFQYMNFCLCHPPGMKKGFIKGEALRLVRTNSSQITFEEYQKFSKLLVRKGLPAANLRKYLFEVKFADRKTALRQINKSAHK